MAKPEAVLEQSAWVESERPTPPAIQPWRNLLLALGGLTLLFAVPLLELARFSYASETYSYILLIPVVSVYLAWPARANIVTTQRPYRPIGLALLVGSIGALALSTIGHSARDSIATEDHLFVTTAAFVVAVIGVCAMGLSRNAFRAIGFPLGFLCFMTPIPSAVLASVANFMQYGSATVAHALFEGTGTSVYYDHLVFQLPGITLFVAPECSGMRSTLVLLILSVLMGHVFLRSYWARTLLALAILPLAIARNGFRIFVVGELCVQRGPAMIDSFIHRKGGPIFFALSLIPLFAFLIWLRRRERRASALRSAP